MTRPFCLHEESTVTVPAPAGRVFAHLDDHARLAGHMNQRSWRMGWGKLETVMDDAHGRAVGSRIAMHGRVFGIRVDLDEVVTRREPPLAKTWETVGEPRLIVIGAYQMGFRIQSQGETSRLVVWIDYDWPSRGLSRLLGRAFGAAYARWCTRQMTRDAVRAF